VNGENAEVVRSTARHRKSIRSRRRTAERESVIGSPAGGSKKSVMLVNLT
jgi:hypothetical protein